MGIGFHIQVLPDGRITGVHNENRHSKLSQLFLNEIEAVRDWHVYLNSDSLTTKTKCLCSALRGLMIGACVPCVSCVSRQ